MFSTIQRCAGPVRWTQQLSGRCQVSGLVAMPVLLQMALHSAVRLALIVEQTLFRHEHRLDHKLTNIASLYRIGARSSLPVHVWRLSRLCQSSTSLLVRTDDWKADKLLAGHNRLWIHVANVMKLYMTRTFPPWGESSRELSPAGAKVPRMELSSESSKDGTFTPGARFSKNLRKILGSS